MERNTSREKGYSGEDRAVDYLINQGCSIVSRNFQARRGEIDCIATDPSGTLLFIEVKFAKSNARGNPAFWVTPAKRKKIIAMAKRYLGEHGLARQACRFDVILITNDKIEHIKNAFLS
jgi:putative endonuclease